MDLSPQIQSAVDATLALRKEFIKKKSLLHDDSEVFLQVTLLKQPVVEEARRGFVYLAHSLAGNTGDVCLFVKNAFPNDHIARTPDERIEFSIDYYKDILEKHKIKGISAIMPLKQLRNEYGNYELKRKLANRFDLFLCDLSLLQNGRFTSNLGKFFIKNHKFPIGVKFPKQGQYDRRFPNRMKRALNTSYFDIKRHSDNYSIPVGLTSHTKEQLTENVSLAIKQISQGEKIPGGFKNVKSILLKSERSKAVPIYFNLESKNNVPVPHVKSKTPKTDPIEGELSTIPGMRVIVYPNGEVVLKKSKHGDDSGSEVSDFESEEEEEEEEEKEMENGVDNDDEVKKKVEKKDKKLKKKKDQKKKEGESESEDEEADNAEQKYLSNWLEETAEEEDKEERKEVQGTKKQKKQNKAVKRKAENAENLKKSKKVRKEQRSASKEGKGKASKVKVNHVEAPKENKKVAQVLKEKKGKNKDKSAKLVSNLEKKGNKRTGLQGKEKKPKKLTSKMNVEVKKGKVAKTKK